MAKDPCCIKPVNVDFNVNYNASATFRSNYGNQAHYGDINKGITSADISIDQGTPSVDVNIDGQTGGISDDFKNQVIDNFNNIHGGNVKGYPSWPREYWSQDPSYNPFNSLTPEQQVENEIEENWNDLSDIEGGSLTENGDYTHGSSNPYKTTAKSPSARFQRWAEFCGGNFVRWLDNENDPLTGMTPP